MSNRNAVTSAVTQQNIGTVEELYGPTKVSDVEVWEVWVKHRGQYETRFVTCDKSQQMNVYHDFQQLALCLEQKFQALAPERHQSLVILYVAVFVFLLSVAMLFYMMHARMEINVYSFGVLASLIASGATMFFGRWKQVRL